MFQMVSNNALESSALMITVTSDDSSKRSEEIPLPSNKQNRVRAAFFVESSESEVKENFTKWWKRTMWKPCVYHITLGMLISMLMGLNMS
ncbi:hypothetical protein CRYUN_Cryun07bG0105400 [Craigia yunnanensis]